MWNYVTIWIFKRFCPHIFLHDLWWISVSLQCSSVFYIHFLFEISVLGRSVGRRLVVRSVSGSNVRSVIISSRRKGREVTLSGLIRMLIFYLEILMVQIKDPACSATTIYNQGQQGQAGKVVHFCESKLTFNRVTYWVMT